MLKSVVLLDIFVETISLFQDYLINGKFKITVFEVLTVTFDQFNALLLNESITEKSY